MKKSNLTWNSLFLLVLLCLVQGENIDLFTTSNKGGQRQIINQGKLNEQWINYDQSGQVCQKPGAVEDQGVKKRNFTIQNNEDYVLDIFMQFSSDNDDLLVLVEPSYFNLTKNEQKQFQLTYFWKSKPKIQNEDNFRFLEKTQFEERFNNILQRQFSYIEDEKQEENKEKIILEKGLRLLEQEKQFLLDEDYEGRWGKVTISLFLNKVSDKKIHSNSVDSSLQFSILEIESFKQSNFDWSIVVLCVASVLIVALGSIESQTPIIIDDEEQVEELSPWHALYFIVFGSVVLVVLFYFMDQLQQILFYMILVSVFFSLNTLGVHFIENLSLQSSFFTSFIQKLSYEIPYCGKINLISFLFSVSLISFYAYTKHYMASNFIAFFMVITMFKLIRIENYKTAFFLLTLAFFYDIYWVFFSEYFFHKSVMETVASQIDLPMKFVCPHFRPNPFKRCSLIGLGDLVLPGTLISYCYRWDLKNNTTIFFKTSMLGYIVGLTTCMAVLIVYSHGQPALLYLTPSTLIPTALVAYYQNQFSSFWKGIPSFNSSPIPQFEMV